MSKRVVVDFDGFRLTESGKRKVWRSNMEPDYCCCLEPMVFIWEKNTKHNDYNGYSGYMNPKYVIELS